MGSGYETLATVAGVSLRDVQETKFGNQKFRLTAYSEEDQRLVLGTGIRPESRRFALARLLGEEILMKEDRQFSFVTKSRTYRQKFQRAFAAEFLCPREDVLARLSEHEWDEDAITDIAEHFGVSTMIIQHALENDSHSLDPLDRSAA